MTTGIVSQACVRALTRDDLQAVVAIDSATEGHPRAPYFQRRVAAAIREPDLHAQLASEDEHGVNGFILARVLEGEFGRERPSLRLEVIGVRPADRGRGVGTRLLEALIAWSRRHGIEEIRTQATWNNHAMMRWLDHSRFTLAASHIVDCPVGAVLDTPAREQDTEALHPSHEVDYSDAPGNHNHFERLARDVANVRTMTREDLDAIARIDRHVTARERRAYIEHKLAEAIDDSAVRVSLSAETDGGVVGYVMARVDYGDFGRPEPVAVLDTIGVDPGYTHRGVAHALLSQLCANLFALRIERVETIVAPRDLALLGFLYDAGFRPSQRVPFVRPVTAATA